MSVPKDERSHGQLEVNIATLDLCTYTLKITANENVFPAEQKAFIDKLRDTVLEIHLLCWEANNIRVNKDPDRFWQRINMEQTAADHCNRMCALIEVAKPLFHLSSQRCVYWTEKVVDVRNLIHAWSESDSKRLNPRLR